MEPYLVTGLSRKRILLPHVTTTNVTSDESMPAFASISRLTVCVFGASTSARSQSYEDPNRIIKSNSPGNPALYGFLSGCMCGLSLLTCSAFWCNSARRSI
jgi:hypothetical protein